MIGLPAGTRIWIAAGVTDLQVFRHSSYPVWKAGTVRSFTSFVTLRSIASRVYGMCSNLSGSRPPVQFLSRIFSTRTWIIVPSLGRDSTLRIVSVESSS
jgi:hypothetical protein